MKSPKMAAFTFLSKQVNCINKVQAEYSNKVTSQTKHRHDIEK